METSVVQIREIRPEDNAAVAKLVRQVLVDMGVPKVGTAYADTALDGMYEHYNKARAVYFVAVEANVILGCAGIAPLDNYKGNVCELQKMYVLPQAQGRGLGKGMMKACLESAVAFGFEQCYLETMPYMKAAQALYKKVGFRYIEAPMGDTGHYSCSVWMLKTL